MWPFVKRNQKKPTDPVHPGTIQLGVSYDLLQPQEGLGAWISIWRHF